MPERAARRHSRSTSASDFDDSPGATGARHDPDSDAPQVIGHGVRVRGHRPVEDHQRGVAGSPLGRERRDPGRLARPDADGKSGRADLRPDDVVGRSGEVRRHARLPGSVSSWSRTAASTAAVTSSSGRPASTTTRAAAA